MAAMQAALRVSTMVVLAVLAAACGGGGKPSPRAPAAGAAAPAHPREGELLVLATVGSPAAALGEDFERASGCKVRWLSAASDGELLLRAAQEVPDLVLASGQNADSLVSAGLVRALDGARLPQLAAVDARLRAHPGSVVAGRRYGVAWQWQPIVLAYDETKQAQPTSSWQVLFEPGPAKPGEAVQVLPGSDPMLIANAALYLAATQPALGIRDPYALNERQYAQVLALLRAHRADWRGAERGLGAQVEAFRNGVSAAASTPALVRGMRGEGLPVAWTLPAGAGSARVAIAMLHAKAKHPNCAYAWMDWALAPATQARLAGEAGALPVTTAACKLEPLKADDACARDGMALLPRLYLQRVPQARCGKAACVPYSEWTRDYLALAGE